MGNEGIVALAVIGVIAVGAYVLNIGGIKDKINQLIMPLRTQGVDSFPNQGIAVGEFNPSTPSPVNNYGCPNGQTLTTAGCRPIPPDPCGPKAHGVKTGKGLVCVPN